MQVSVTRGNQWSRRFFAHRRTLPYLKLGETGNQGKDAQKRWRACLRKSPGRALKQSTSPFEQWRRQRRDGQAVMEGAGRPVWGGNGAAWPFLFPALPQAAGKHTPALAQGGSTRCMS